ncbi:hypothetical protein ACFWJT_05745 [Streptomyces sp. NPDC127069]|uniref:hypothetical protein n=1 Tax=Streptomyces sp. NPDC127069 TaxID=3347128 RepID=UPI0036690E9B
MADDEPQERQQLWQQCVRTVVLPSADSGVEPTSGFSIAASVHPAGGEGRGHTARHASLREHSEAALKTNLGDIGLDLNGQNASAPSPPSPAGYRVSSWSLMQS